MFKLSCKRKQLKPLRDPYVPPGHSYEMVGFQAFMWKCSRNNEVVHLLYDPASMVWEPVGNMNYQQFQQAKKLLTT